MAPLIELMKCDKFTKTTTAFHVFVTIKENMKEAFILQLIDFSKPFKVSCDASSVVMDGVLS